MNGQAFWRVAGDGSVKPMRWPDKWERPAGGVHCAECGTADPEMFFTPTPQGQSVQGLVHCAAHRTRGEVS